MTTDHDELLAKIEEMEKGYDEWSLDTNLAYLAPYLAFSALRAVVELCKPYCEHNIKNVTKVNGVYDKEQAEAWEKVHGHDIRLNCYPEFGCQLLIDPEDLLLAIKKELG